MQIRTDDIPKEPAVRRAWVTYQLKIRGITLAAIGRDEGVSANAVANALLNPSSYLEEAIARRLDLTARQLFAERFNKAGERINQTKPRNRTSPAPAHNVHFAGAR